MSVSLSEIEIKSKFLSQNYHSSLELMNVKHVAELTLKLENCEKTY